MFAIMRGRQAGKTDTLIKVIKNKPKSILVVFSMERVHYLRKSHPAIAKRITTYQQLLDGFPCYQGSHEVDVKQVYIDDVDLFLKRVMPDNTSLCGFTGTVPIVFED